MFITLSVVYIQISNTYLPEFPNILLYVEANPVWMCRLHSAVIFSSKLDYSYRTTNVLKAFFSAIHAVWSLWSWIYHEFKEILRKLSLSEYFKAISLYFRVYSLSGLTTARYTSSSSSLLALDFKSPFSLQYSFDGKSSPARIPSHLLNLTLSWACRSLSVVLEIDRDSPIVNIVWQTMNKDTSLS